jgi:hypothetical protein
MEQLLQNSLPSLTNELAFRVEKITSLDYYYTDGTAVGSCLKLVVERIGSSSTIYIYPSGSYWTTSSLTDDEKSTFDGWLETVKSKKLNQVPQLK